MEIYTITFSVLVCLAILLAFSSRFARLGFFALILIFGVDIVYSLYFIVDYVRFILDIFVAGMVVAELIKNWSGNTYSVLTSGVIASGALFAAIGVYSFLQNGSFIYAVFGASLIVIGVWRYMRKTKT